MIQRVRQRLKSDFIRNVATLVTGTTAAQAVSILTAPILYRIYDREAYGTLGQYLAIVGVVGVFSTMQYLQVILLEKDDDNAKKMMWLNRFINIGLTVILTIVVLLFNMHIANLLNNPKVAVWLYLLPLSIFFSGQNAIFRVWANRKKKYKLMTFNAILTSISVPIVSISVGLINGSVLGLFLGLLTSQIIPPIVLLIGLTRKEDLGLKYFDFDFIKSKAKAYKNFPLYNMPSEFINRFTNQLPVFMLSTYAGTGVVGVYNLCVRMLGLPVQLIGGAIAEVFKQKASQDFNETGSFDQIFLKTLKTLAGTSIIPFIALIIFAPDVFEFVFGTEWREAGIFARILGVLFVFRFIVSPLSFSFIITNKLREDMLWHIWMLISNLLIFLFGFKYLTDYKLVLILFAGNYSLIYMIYIIRSFAFSKIKNNEH
ncbi:MAG: lipopolysaccharide biosynthesis protein [Bacteroidia bacterium]